MHACGHSMRMVLTVHMAIKMHVVLVLRVVPKEQVVIEICFWQVLDASGHKHSRAHTLAWRPPPHVVRIHAHHPPLKTCIKPPITLHTKAPCAPPTFGDLHHNHQYPYISRLHARHPPLETCITTTNNPTYQGLHLPYTQPTFE